MTDLLSAPIELPPRGPLELRVSGTLDVSFPERRITLCVMPYEQEALVEYRGRLITEVCSPGSFEGIEKRHRPPRAFRDHDRRRVVGHASALHADRADGLIAEIDVSSTPLGDETLQLAASGDLDASAGFNVLRGGERWSGDRNKRRLTRLWLDHIALTADPAYPGAQVLDVRSAPPADLILPPEAKTPRKDAALARLATLGYDPAK